MSFRGKRGKRGAAGQEKRKAASPVDRRFARTKSRRLARRLAKASAASKDTEATAPAKNVSNLQCDMTAAELAPPGSSDGSRDDDAEFQAFVDVASKISCEEDLEALLHHELHSVRQLAVDLKRSTVPETPTAGRLLFGASGAAPPPRAAGFTLRSTRLVMQPEFQPLLAPAFVSTNADRYTLNLNGGLPSWVHVSEVSSALKVQEATYKYEFDPSGNIMVPPHILRVPDVHNASVTEIFSFQKLASVFFWKGLRDFGKGGAASSFADYTSGSVSSLSDDAYFVVQRLLGVNPAAIKVLSDSARTLVNSGLTASGQPKLSSKDKLFMCDYSILKPFSERIMHGNGADGQYVPAPIVVLKYTEATSGAAAQFTPEAILYDQAGQYANAVRQADNSPQWEFGKMCARVADWNCHELGSHLTLCHLVSEVAMVAMYRTLPKTHPIFQLLLPHFYMTLPLNANARSQLVPEIIAEKLTAFTSEQCFQFIAAVYTGWDFEAHYVPTDLQTRGVADLPEKIYPFGKTAALVWDSVHTYVNNVVQHLETIDQSKPVLGDPCLQNFLQTLREGEAKLPGFPNVTTNEALVDALTMIIYTASHQHSAVNYFQEQFLSYCPQAPSVIAVPPVDIDTITNATLLKALPTPRTAKMSAAVFDMLSEKPEDDHQLEMFQLQDTPDNVQWKFLDAFLLQMQASLKKNLEDAQIPVAAMISKDCLAQSVLI
eukprot:m.84881 g.84881  ORF g.84881 m.84881 type:complete len:716 (-) comp16359_c0_seq1:57-2204(-)